MTDAHTVLKFWFEDIERKSWFEKDDAFDQTLIERFGALHEQAASGALSEWEDDPKTCLALIIVLDQFSRNMFRGDPKSFAQDSDALRIAKTAIERGYDKEFDHEHVKFFYLPFEHSENLQDQETCCDLFRDFPDDSLKWAEAHHVIIERFGRFPHRNEALSRESTPEEIEFLSQPNSSF